MPRPSTPTLRGMTTAELLVEGIAVALLLGATSGCGSSPTTAFNLGDGGRFNTIVSLQGWVKTGVPMAFNLEDIGCVEDGPSLTVESMTLHAPHSGVKLVDWGATAAKKQFFDWGVFNASKHPLTQLGLSKRPWTGRCPRGGEQVAVVLELVGTAGATAGIDIHFTNGTTTWVPTGLGLCSHGCPNGLSNQMSNAISKQRGY